MSVLNDQVNDTLNRVEDSVVAVRSVKTGGGIGSIAV